MPLPHVFTCTIAKYDKAIEYATKVLGNDPALVMRDWGTLGSLSLNDDLQPDAYVDASNRANLLLYTARSYWGLYNGPPYHNQPVHTQPTISKNETSESTGIWGDCSTTLKQIAANYTSIPKVVFRKYLFSTSRS